MSRRPPAASWFSPGSVLSAVAAVLFACWNGCALDRSGLSSGVEPATGTGGQTPPAHGSGGNPATGLGGAAVHFGSGGASPGTGGQPGIGASGGYEGPGSGGAGGSGVVAASGGVSGQATGGKPANGTGGSVVATGGAVGGSGNGAAGGSPSGGRGGETPGTGGSASPGSGGASSGGKGGGTTGSGGSSAGGESGSGGSGSGIPACDPSIRDRDACVPGTPACGETCGVSNLGTATCTCSTNRKWTCGACVYPPGDYSCYQLPSTKFVTACPPTAVNGGACLGNCTVCATYSYNSGATPTSGYCACTQAAGSNQHVYQCASASDWPQ